MAKSVFRKLCEQGFQEERFKGAYAMWEIVRANLEDARKNGEDRKAFYLCNLLEELTLELDNIAHGG